MQNSNDGKVISVCGGEKREQHEGKHDTDYEEMHQQQEGQIWK
jgi:hypothetical protein